MQDMHHRLIFKGFSRLQFAFVAIRRTKYMIGVKIREEILVGNLNL